VQYISPNVRRLLGYEAQELLGQNLFRLIHPDDLASVHLARADLLAEGTPLPVTFRIANREGVWVWMETFGNGCEIWVEVSTAFATGNSWQIQVTYTNSAGTSGRTSIISAAQNAAALTLGKMFQIALQAGDTGVQKIESVIATNGGTAMTAGAVNVLIMRPLWFNRVAIANGGGINNLLDTGMIQIYNDSALYLIVQPDSTSTGLPYVTIEIANA
jgi:hypothetical protein